MQSHICVFSQMCLYFHTLSETDRGYRIIIYQQSAKAKNWQSTKYTFLPACHNGYEMINECNNQQREYQPSAKKTNVCEIFDNQPK